MTRAVVFDVDFSSPSNPAADLAFADALQKAGGSVVLPAFKQLVPDGEGGKTVYVRPLATILDEAIDDFGANGINDALSVYCVTTAPSAPRGTLAMCLTFERCPWR